MTSSIPSDPSAGPPAISEPTKTTSESATEEAPAPGHEDRAHISTGTPEIDRKLGGGILRGSLTLVEGESGAGKSVLGQQMVWGALTSGCRVILYTTETTTQDYLRRMDGLGLEVMDFLLLGRFKVVPIASDSNEINARTLDLLVSHLGASASYDLALIDALTPMVLPTPATRVVSFFEQCRELCSKGIAIVSTLHTHAADEDTRGRVRSLCDANLALSISEVGDQLASVLEVTRINGATKQTAEYVGFRVEPEVGLQIIPISFAKI